MIAEIVRGDAMPELISYLFGPGRHNEHLNQHLIAGYADAVFTAPDRLWQSEPGVQRKVPREARELGWQVEYPRSRWGSEVPHGHVWHCSLAIKAEEGQLTDTQWTEAAHAMIDALGFSGEDGKAPCRWVAVRHGLSAEGNDHIHIAVNLVREDGTKASTWNDYRKAGAVCAGLEARFGLQHVPGRASGRRLPEPSRADREISAARGEAEPLRTRLERKVRACAAAAASEAHFVALARANGLLVRPRYATGDRTRITGYAVADRDGRQAYSSRTKTSGPVWFGGGKLASDLALPRLRVRWHVGSTVTTAEALAAWSTATSLTAAIPEREARGGKLSAADSDCDVSSVAGVLAAAATAMEGSTPGPLSRAARHMARAAQEQDGPQNPAAAEIIRDMAGTFLSVTFAGTDAGAMILVREVARLADACEARAGTAAAQREARRAAVLARASAADLAGAAEAQATATLTTSTRELRMSEPTHEDDVLRHLTQAGVLAAQLARIRFGGPGMSADIARLRAAGYTEHTRHDARLRQLLGEQRWAAYAADPARIVAAAAITDGDRAGFDMPALLAKVVNQRRWEDDSRSPSQSVARVLYFRVTREMARTLPATVSARSSARRADRADPGDSAAPSPAGFRVPGQVGAGRSSPRRDAVAGPLPKPVTAYDGKLRELLGEQCWHQYADDPRRSDVAALISRADREGRDVSELLTTVITSRPFGDDPLSPARNVAHVLHYRIKRELSCPQRPDGPRPATGLPDQIAGVLSHGTAPTGTGPREGTRTDPAVSQAPPPARSASRPPGERDSR